MRTALGMLAVVFAVTFAPPKADAAALMLHMQGRGWKGWDSMQSVSASGWTNVYFNYDGNSALTNSTTTSEINNYLINNCNSTVNQCVVLCYSAGCLRMQKAVSDLRASGYTLSGLLWAEATASAAGGTGLAELATQGGTKILAKLLGQQEKIDFSLTPSAARAQAQSNFGKTIYHVSGKNDLCKGFWVFKICGNSYVGHGGRGDGVVPFHSSFGCSSATTVYDCNCTKYAYHSFENRVSGALCAGQSFDHFGMVNSGCQITKAALGQSSSAVLVSWSDSTSNGACTTTTDSCDDRFAVTAQNYSKKTDLTAIATSVATKASNTTLYTDSRYIAGPAAYGDDSYGAGWRYTCGGKCGGANTIGGVTRCRCDSGCTSRGDCCSDYSTTVCTGRGLNSTDCANNTARCDVVNAQ